MEILLTIITLLLAGILYMLYIKHKELNQLIEQEDEIQEKRYDKYDIDSFHKRMTDLRNSEYTNEEVVDGVKLYQVQDKPPKDYNDSGVEVITPSMELNIERRIRS